MNCSGGNKGGIITAAIMGFLVAIALSLFAASKVKSTSTAEFCASCHEMGVFHETWENSVHGKVDKGVVKAECVDCHLPHDGLIDYLTTKTKAGIHDFTAHVTGKKTDWISKWVNRGPHAHTAYESGCKKCHKDLVAPGIPIKAFTAHRAYELGETTLHCMDCHQQAGHGDIVSVLREKS